MATKKFRTVALLLTLVMTLTVALSGCTVGGGGKIDDDYVMDPVLNELGSETICKEPVDISIMIAQSGTVIDYDTNTFTKRLEEKGNLNIVFQLLPVGDAETKVNLTLSSGTDLPDMLVYPLEDTMVATYGEEGTFIPLNKYYEHSSEYVVPSVEELIADGGIDVLEYLTMSDGNIYTLPRYPESVSQDFSRFLWINKIWLDNLGLEEPTTLEEFTATLRAFKENDANGNGNKGDEIPMMHFNDPDTDYSLLNTVKQGFIRSGTEGLVIGEDGQLYFDYMSEGYKDFLKYMKMLVAEGLYDKTSFSQDQATLKTLLNAETARVGVFCATSTSILTGGTPRRDNHEYVPIILDNGDNRVMYYTKVMPINYTFITKDAEHPEVAFRLGDFMCSEEMSIWTRWGQEGVDWVAPPEGTKGMYDFLGAKAIIDPVLQWGSVQNSHWQGGTPLFRRARHPLGVVGGDASQQAKANAIKLAYERYGEDNYTYPVDSFIAKLIYTSDELDERAEIMTSTNSYVNSMLYEFVTGGKDIDKDWDAYIKELKALNIDRLLEISQTAYDRMKK